MKKLILTLSFLIVVGCSSGSGNNPVAGTEPETNPKMTKTSPETNTTGDASTIKCEIWDSITAEYVAVAEYDPPRPFTKGERQNFCTDLGNYVRGTITATCTAPGCYERRMEEIESAIRAYISIFDREIKAVEGIN